MKDIKVLIVEDSKLMQDLLSKILSSDPDIQVVGIADDPLIARDLIKKTNPNVVTLDIMLPHMDGITFLKNLMRLHPIPVVMISTLTENESAIAMESLANGAVDYLLKPTHKDMNDLSTFSKELIESVKTAANANVSRSVIPVTAIDNKLKDVIYKMDLLKKELIVIGASTGGIEAIETILLQLPRILPPVVIVQHIKKEFSAAFSNRIRRIYGLSVIDPENRTEILPGNIYVSSSRDHLLIEKCAGQYIATYRNDQDPDGYQPSIDVLFKSAALAAKNHALGVLLTGMGKDGAEGLKAIRDAGGNTIAQDEESSIVWGMPGAAVKLNAAEFILPLNEIPKNILHIIDRRMLKPISA